MIPVARGADGASFNASIYVKLTAPDRSVYETTTRRVLAEGQEENLPSTRWGVQVSFHQREGEEYEVLFRVLQKSEFGSGLEAEPWN